MSRGGGALLRMEALFHATSDVIEAHALSERRLQSAQHRTRHPHAAKAQSWQLVGGEKPSQWTFLRRPSHPTWSRSGSGPTTSALPTAWVSIFKRRARREGREALIYASAEFVRCAGCGAQSTLGGRGRVVTSRCGPAPITLGFSGRRSGSTALHIAVNCNQTISTFSTVCALAAPRG